MSLDANRNNSVQATKNNQTQTPEASKKPLRFFITQEIGVGASLCVLIGIFSLLQPLFWDRGNFLNISRQAAEPALLAMGQAVAMLAGGFDLSIGGIMGLTSAVVAYAVLSVGVIPGMVIGVLLGTFIGFINGTLIARYRLPPFIVTLGMLSLCRGLAYIITGGLPVLNLPEEFSYLGSTGYVGGLPIATIIAVVIFCIFYTVLTRSKFGYDVYSIGGNESAARLAGINVARIRTLIYMISGSLASIASILLSSRVSSGQPSLGDGAELLSVAAVIIGGVRLRGGQGSLFGVMLGVALLAILANGLNLINMSSYVQLVAVGLIVMVASVGSVIRGPRSEE
ncbi:MAG: ABC transporter permease [Betaproteobacteria bacterium]|nr:ABC transporter permease [Betaproteobacteria bacterium]